MIKTLLIIGVVFSTSLSAQSTNQDKKKKEDLIAEDNGGLRLKELSMFNKNIVPLLKEKNISEQRINALRILPAQELSVELGKIGINPNDIEVK